MSIDTYVIVNSVHFGTFKCRFWCKKLNDLKIFFQTWPYWYYYLKKKKVRDQDGKKKTYSNGNIIKQNMILWTVRWYLRYNLSFRDLVEMMEERGLSLSHTTIMRWVHQYGN
jgi:hypothetical protein